MTVGVDETDDCEGGMTDVCGELDEVIECLVRHRITHLIPIEFDKPFGFLRRTHRGFQLSAHSQPSDSHTIAE